MRLRCVSVNDVGMAGQLDKFANKADSQAQQFYDDHILKMANYNGRDRDQLLAKYQTKLMGMMPDEASLDYVGQSSYVQIMDGLKEAGKLTENVVCIIHTDGLLDALVDPSNCQSEKMNNIKNINGTYGRQ